MEARHSLYGLQEYFMYTYTICLIVRVVVAIRLVNRNRIISFISFLLEIFPVLSLQ